MTYKFFYDNNCEAYNGYLKPAIGECFKVLTGAMAKVLYVDENKKCFSNVRTSTKGIQFAISRVIDVIDEYGPNRNIYEENESTRWFKGVFNWVEKSSVSAGRLFVELANFTSYIIYISDAADAKDLKEGSCLVESIKCFTNIALRAVKEGLPKEVGEIEFN